MSDKIPRLKAEKRALELAKLCYEAILRVDKALAKAKKTNS